MRRAARQCHCINIHNGNALPIINSRYRWRTQGYRIASLHRHMINGVKSGSFAVSFIIIRPDDIVHFLARTIVRCCRVWWTRFMTKRIEEKKIYRVRAFGRVTGSPSNLSTLNFHLNVFLLITALQRLFSFLHVNYIACMQQVSSTGAFFPLISHVVNAFYRGNVARDLMKNSWISI